MLVRARCRQDTRNLYELAKDLPPVEKPNSDETRDYRWRVSLDRNDWLTLAGRLAAGVGYSNFKSAVAKEPSQQKERGLSRRMGDAVPSTAKRTSGTETGEAQSEAKGEECFHRSLTATCSFLSVRNPKGQMV